MQRDRDPVTDGDDRASTRAGGATVGALPGGDATVDERSEASFPASDPPATWTLEVQTNVADAGDSDSPKRRSRTSSPAAYATKVASITTVATPRSSRST